MRRPLLFGFLHDVHYFGVPGVDRPLVGVNRQCRIAVNRAGQDLGTWCLGHHVRFTGQIRFVHHAVAFPHRTVHRADFMGKDNQLVADVDIGQ